MEKFWDYELLITKKATIRILESDLGDNEDPYDVAEHMADSLLSDDFETDGWELNVIDEGIE